MKYVRGFRLNLEDAKGLEEGSPVIVVKWGEEIIGTKHDCIIDITEIGDCEQSLINLNFDFHDNEEFTKECEAYFVSDIYYTFYEILEMYEKGRLFDGDEIVLTYDENTKFTLGITSPPYDLMIKALFKVIKVKQPRYKVQYIANITDSMKLKALTLIRAAYEKKGGDINKDSYEFFHLFEDITRGYFPTTSEYLDDGILKEIAGILRWKFDYLKHEYFFENNDDVEF